MSRSNGTTQRFLGTRIRLSMPTYRGLSALVTMSHVAPRFFLPQVAGLPVFPPATGVFPIDHDKNFNQTTHIEYQPKKGGDFLSTFRGTH